MDTVHELIPLAREAMARRPGRGLLKLYMLGGVLALFGVVLGLVETVCSPFSASSRLREEEAAAAELRAAQERQALRTPALLAKDKQPAAGLGNRAGSKRQHAS